MQVQVQLFHFRECLPQGSEGGIATVVLPDGCTVADLVSHLKIHERLGCEPTEIVRRANWLVQVNGRFDLDPERALQNGDQVTMFPVLVGG